jgi:hypothetical protein
MLRALRDIGGISGLGAASFDYCEFLGSYRYSEAAKAVQEVLIAKGASGLKADGLWGPCSGQAFVNVFGEPLTKESLERHLGIKCKEAKISPLGPCSDGSDKLTPGVTPSVTIPPEMNIPIPTAQPAPRLDTSILRLISPLSVRTTVDRSKLAQLRIAKPTETPGNGGAGIQQSSMVSGVPDWLLGVGIVAAVAGAAYFYTRR